MNKAQILNEIKSINDRIKRNVGGALEINPTFKIPGYTYSEKEGSTEPMSSLEKLVLEAELGSLYSGLGRLIWLETQTA